jgi:hypothetical protein
MIRILKLDLENFQIFFSENEDYKKQIENLIKLKDIIEHFKKKNEKEKLKFYRNEDCRFKSKLDFRKNIPLRQNEDLQFDTESY